jgi:outer membrane protein assembly factor BamA
MNFPRISFLVFLVVISGFLSAQDTLRADTSLYVIRSISYSGNKQTKVFIMEHELSFKVGDTISGIQFQNLARHSEQNLLNTSLFNFANIYPSCQNDSGNAGIVPMNISIVVKERWYTWPAPIFDVAEQNFNVWWRNGHNFQRASYGFFLWRYNFRGRKESIALICRFGYSQQFGAQYAVPYLNRKHTIGMTFTGTYTRNHEVSYATQNNKLLYYKDPENRIRGETAGSIMFSYRKGIYWHQTLDFRYTNLTVNDTVIDLDPYYFADHRSQMEYFTISYHVTRDYRDIKAYPLKGHFEELEITKHGLGILADEKLNIFAMAAGVRGYAEIFPRIYIGGMLRTRWNPSKEVPYYHQRALGFGTYIRGYEYYVIDGETYGVAKASVRYAILKPHIFKFSFLPVEKFNTFHLALYGGIFADAGYVVDRNSVSSAHNSLGNTFLFGYGAGFDIVTYYDIALRLEYSFNLRNENGLFVHLGAAF